MIDIRNLNKTKDKSCECNTWKEHWEKHIGLKADRCYIDGCKELDIVGAHIKRVDNGNHFIIPLCRKHNGFSSDIIMRVSIFYRLRFVSANVQKTCGK